MQKRDVAISDYIRFMAKISQEKQRKNGRGRGTEKRWLRDWAKLKAKEKKI